MTAFPESLKRARMQRGWSQGYIADMAIKRCAQKTLWQEAAS